MSELKRGNFSGPYKARIALEAMRGAKTVNEIAQEYEVHPAQVGRWKMALQEQVPALFESGHRAKPIDHASNPQRLYSEIGRLKMKLDWLKKSQGYAHENPQELDPGARGSGAGASVQTGWRRAFDRVCGARSDPAQCLL